MARTAMITGVTGQDGVYLSQNLLQKDYIVHGLKKPSSSVDRQRLEMIYAAQQEKKGNFHLHNIDVSDNEKLEALLFDIQPDEFYNLAAQSHVGNSFQEPSSTTNINAVSVLNILEATRKTGLIEKMRFYQASSSELFGRVNESPQSESTAFYPCSPYAIAKAFAFWTTVNYREVYGLHASNGILYNHESPLRPENYVTRKITKAAASIKLNLQEDLSIGNLEAKRDWGHAKDYVEGMWMMLQQERGDDYILATGKARTVKNLIECAFASVDYCIEWQGEGVNEVGYDLNSGKVLIKVAPEFFRPIEAKLLVGNPEKAQIKLGWQQSVRFEEMIGEMVQEDLKMFVKENKL